MRDENGEPDIAFKRRRSSSPRGRSITKYQVLPSRRTAMTASMVTQLHCGIKRNLISVTNRVTTRSSAGVFAQVKGGKGGRVDLYAGFCPHAPRGARWAAIHLGLPSPAGSSGLPAGSGGPPSNACAGRRSGPSWPCSGWGLPSHPGHPGCWWALTPPFHPYRPYGRRSAFCGTVPRVTPGCR